MISTLTQKWKSCHSGPAAGLQEADLTNPTSNAWQEMVLQFNQKVQITLSSKTTYVCTERTHNTIFVTAIT